MTSVLIVDDDSLCAEELAEALEYERLDTAWTDNPLEVAKLVRERRATLRLVITDLKMPEMDGTELIAALGAENPALRFIIVTGHSAMLCEEQAKDSPVLARLPKPVCIPKLLALMRELGL